MSRLLRKLIYVIVKIRQKLCAQYNYIVKYRSQVKKIQSIIDTRKANHKIISFVMCNAGQQQFFEDIYNYSIEKKKDFYFFIVNDYLVNDNERIKAFQELEFITPEVYRYLKRIDLALHAEIHCRSPQVKNVCFIGHGFPGKHTIWSSENLKSFNHYFMYGPRDRKILEFLNINNLSPINHISFWEVGYPKYDKQLNNHIDLELTKINLRIKTKKPIILYAPAWDPRGSLRSYGKQLFELMGSMADYNFIIKLHPVSLVSKTSTDYEFYTGGVDWAQVVNHAVGHFDNLYFYTDRSINPLMKIADVMITDFSGVALGFFLENKPVISIDCPEYFSKTLPEWGQDGNLSKSNELFNNGRNASHLITELDQLQEMIRFVLENPNSLEAERQRIATELLYNRGTGTEHAVKTICSILNV